MPNEVPNSVTRIHLWSVALIAILSVSTSVRAAIPDPSDLCDEVAARVATESGVPLSVLRAISLTETGRTKSGAFRPWPWTVNMEGKGVWFDDRNEALEYVHRHHRRGARSFDVGCFQLNYRWHGDAFESIEHMFDPLENARYAAGFLSGLFKETGTWGKAAGAYHSRTRKYASKYQERFERICARLSDRDLPETQYSSAPMAAAPEREHPAVNKQNNFPLLMAGGQGRALGSLVALGAPAAGKRLIDFD